VIIDLCIFYNFSTREKVLGEFFTTSILHWWCTQGERAHTTVHEDQCSGKECCPPQSCAQLWSRKTCNKHEPQAQCCSRVQNGDPWCKLWLWSRVQCYDGK